MSAIPIEKIILLKNNKGILNIKGEVEDIYNLENYTGSLLYKDNLPVEEINLIMIVEQKEKTIII